MSEDYDLVIVRTMMAEVVRRHMVGNVAGIPLAETRPLKGLLDSVKDG